jgi:hypothetical protein
LLEYWSTGVVVERLNVFLQQSSTPALQYSIAPMLHDR